MIMNPTNKNKTNSYCFVPGCTTGSKNNRKKRKLTGDRSLGLFFVPRDHDIFQQWKSVIPVKNREFTADDRICELHFAEDDIERFYVTQLPDGSINKIERGKLKLKKGAIPIKFSASTSSKRKQPTSVERAAKKARIENHDTGTLNLDQSDDIQFETSINLKLTIGKIPLPNQWWGVSCTPEFIIFAKWNKDSSLEKKVVIGNNLDVKVFIGSREICIKDVYDVSSIQDASRLLQEIDNYHTCAGNEDKSMLNCIGFLENRKDGRASIFCQNCRRDRYLTNKRLRRSLKSKCNNFHKVQRRLSYTLKKNRRLKLKENNESGSDSDVDPNSIMLSEKYNNDEEDEDSENTSSDYDSEIII